MLRPESNQTHLLNKVAEGVLLFSIVIFGALRFFKLDFQSPWVDEIYTLMDTHPMNSVWQAVHQAIVNEGHPPLYFLGVTLWNKCLGSSVESVRFLSALLGLGSIALVYRLGRALLNKETGLIAALLLSANHSHIYYSQEARSYTLSFCLIMALWLAANRYYLHQQLWYLVLAVLLLVLGALNSVFVFFIANIVLCCYTLLLLLKKNYEALLRIILALITGNALVLPVYYYISNQYTYPTNSWLLNVNLVEVLRVGSQYLFLNFWVKLLYCFSLLAAFIVGFRKQKAELLLLIGVPLLFLLLAYIFSILSRPILAGRYLVFLLPFTIIALAFLIAQLRFLFLKVVVSVLIVTAWLGKLHSDEYFFSPRKSEFKPFYTFISNSPLQHLPVVCTEFPIHSFFVAYGGYNAQIVDQQHILKDSNQINRMKLNGWVELYLHQSYFTDSLHRVVAQTTPFKCFYSNRFSTIKINIPEHRLVKVALKQQNNREYVLQMSTPVSGQVNVIFSLSSEKSNVSGKTCQLIAGKHIKSVVPSLKKSLHNVEFSLEEEVQEILLVLPGPDWGLDDVLIFK